jgi:hypothetical protein
MMPSKPRFIATSLPSEKPTWFLYRKSILANCYDLAKEMPCTGLRDRVEKPFFGPPHRGIFFICEIFFSGTGGWVDHMQPHYRRYSQSPLLMACRCGMI